MKFVCVTLLIISGITDSRADKFDVAGPAVPLMAVSGEDVILPCSVKPSISAVNMRVEWSRLDQRGSVVHLYEDHEDRNTDQLPSYRGRTRLFKDELEKGNTSLKLSRVQISDEGLYKCFVKSKSWYDDITVNLRVEAVGSAPVITVDGFDGSGGLHLQCESKGWNPKPELVWLNSEGVTLTSEYTDTHTDTDGFNVKHTITVYKSDTKYHCRVKLKHHMMEIEIITSSKMLHSLKASVVLISFGAVLSVIGIILIAMFVCKKRELQSKSQRLQRDDERLQRDDERIQREQLRIINERETFSENSLREKRILETVVQHLRKYAANVTLDVDSAHPHLIVSHDKKQVRIVNTQPIEEEEDEDEVQNNKFDEYLCVLGNEGFSSDSFYYEVQVKELPVWYVGVASESINRKGQISLNPENGYWSVGLSSDMYWACENPYVPLSLSVKPQRVGVFVNYEEGRVSFYDVETMCHIYTYTSQSLNEKLYPVFCLGHDVFLSENSAPLIICSDLS
ncbi:putative butyrophilin subfamily 1 member A1-like [Triplophysa rosa]|uniref:Butyrophilin subfamily 1 member A1-like n=2 Tax=Triplophysa rosa TaxID=992332 RepID=A0A9W7WKZ6_TRIRA|nr:putative butyrophilin subfamily 1 member A1-like [Triplophysa rosa]